MPILNIFKRKKTKKGKEEIKPEGGGVKKVKKPKLTKEKKEIKKPSGVIAPIAKKEKEFLDTYKILKIPHVTEKATDLTKINQYIFKVWPRANKFEIKKAIESLYGVGVIGVKIINIPKKKRRLGKVSGWRQGYKKAIVKIKEGQKIEVLPR
jgi:large subunit ribosomal protein L23